mmetsp:Transcript_958/g.2331  ORF Transcript_958/g.2331 Transcript_958/m.2331 type:complete len:273 (-) Transcript_958:567-1385(-)
MPRVQEVVDPLLVPVVRLRLGELVVVVGEAEIDPTPVHVQHISEQLARHHRALDVPARAPATPGALPRGLAALGLLPQREIHLALLALVGREGALPLGHRREHRRRVPRQLPVPVRLAELSDVEIHRPLGLVREAVLDDLLDVLHDLRHELGDAGEDVRDAHAEQLHVLKVLFLVVGGVRAEDPLVPHLRSLGVIEAGSDQVPNLAEQCVHVSARTRLCLLERLLVPNHQPVLVVGSVKLLLDALPHPRSRLRRQTRLQLRYLGVVGGLGVD